MESERRISLANDSCWVAPIALAFYFAALKLIIHFVFNGHYGYFRDELYFLACGEHLDWGYVDHAPLIALAAKMSREVLGESLFAIRFLPAFAGAVKVLLTGLMVRELGGGRIATIIACWCVLLAPGYLVMDNLLTMNAYEPVFWLGCAYGVLLVIHRKETRYWLLFGISAGIGLMNKHSMLLFGFALIVGLLLTKERSTILTKWFLCGGLVAFLIFLPNIIWQFQHDWATIELLQNVRTSGKNVDLSSFEFIIRQLLPMSPFSAPIWLVGIYYFLLDTEGRQFRFLGLTYLSLTLTLILLSGKEYYLFPVYSILFAGGGVFVGRLVENARRWKRSKFALIVLVISAGLVLTPLFLPVLSVDRLIQYQAALGVEVPKSEVGHVGPLPQYFGDQFGWEEMVAKVALAYHGLSSDDQARAAIYAGNYGEAGAIDFFGPKYGLPRAISPHQNYFFWGPRDFSGEVVIVLQGKRERLEQQFISVVEAGVVGHPFAMGEEHFTIYVCRGLKQSLNELWPRLKHWN